MCGGGGGGEGGGAVPCLKGDNYIQSRRQNFVCKFSNNVKSKLYHIKNSKTRGPTVKS